MFSLIISIISIALVAALALASIYYGGEAFNKGTTDADASTIINQGQQIQAAVTMSDIDRNDAVTALADLVTADPSYLQEVPTFQGNDWDEEGANGAAAGYAYLKSDVTALNADVCEALNEKAGVDHTSAPAAGSETGVFGCNDAGAAFYRIGEFYTTN